MNYVSTVCAIEPKRFLNLMGKSSLGVVVDNIKLIDLFSALYLSLV